MRESSTESLRKRSSSARQTVQPFRCWPICTRSGCRRRAREGVSRDSPRRAGPEPQVTLRGSPSRGGWCLRNSSGEANSFTAGARRNTHRRKATAAARPPRRAHCRAKKYAVRAREAAARELAGVTGDREECAISRCRRCSPELQRLRRSSILQRSRRITAVRKTSGTSCKACCTAI